MRTSNTWAGSYSINSGASFVNTDTCSHVVTGPWYFVPNSVVGSGSSVTARYDDFLINLGTLSVSSYHTVGTWTSAAFPVPDSERIESVTVGHSGLTMNRNITRIEFLRNGFIEETFETDITSGASTDFSASVLIENFTDFRVRVFLSGNGTGTPVIESVEVYLHMITDVGAVDMTLLWILVFAIVFLAALGIIPSISFGGIFWIVAGLAGILLAMQIFSVTADALVSAVIGIIGILLILLGIARTATMEV